MIDLVVPYEVRFFLGCIVVGAFWSWVDAIIIDRVIAPQARDVFEELKDVVRKLKD